MQQHYSTSRLRLDVLALPDAPFLSELVNTPEWLQFIGDRHIHTAEDAIRYVQKIMGDPNVHYWVVRLRESQVPLGIITLIKRDYLEHPDIGFAFLARHTKNGYAFEAASAVLADVISSLDHKPVLATTVKENASSIRLLEKLGFRLEREIQREDEMLLLYSAGTSFSEIRMR